MWAAQEYVMMSQLLEFSGNQSSLLAEAGWLRRGVRYPSDLHGVLSPIKINPMLLTE